ncbi:MAG: type 4a pilus biogenesis protein PilO [Actinoplanes sp.]
MGARRGDQLWLIGGVAAIVALIAASWFLVISPKFAEGDQVQADAETTRIKLIELNTQVAKLAVKNKQKATYDAKLKVSETALPGSYNMPAFLRQVQDSGAAVSVQVSGFSVSAPVKSTKSTGATEVPIALTAQGSAENLSKFFTRLQNVQSRAVLINSIGLTKTNDATGLSASIGLTAFCVESPTVTTKDRCRLV